MRNSYIDEILDFICNMSELNEFTKQVLIDRIEPEPDAREYNLAMVKVDENNGKHKRKD